MSSGGPPRWDMPRSTPMARSRVTSTSTLVMIPRSAPSGSKESSGERPIELAIEEALRPGRYIFEHASFSVATGRREIPARMSNDEPMRGFASAHRTDRRGQRPLREQVARGGHPRQHRPPRAQSTHIGGEASAVTTTRAPWRTAQGSTPEPEGPSALRRDGLCRRRAAACREGCPAHCRRGFDGHPGGTVSSMRSGPTGCFDNGSSSVQRLDRGARGRTRAR